MATKAKESTVIGKEKKAPSRNSHITSTKRTTKSSTTTTSSTSKAASTPSTKNIPNYLKPTISSSIIAPPSFKQHKSGSPPNKPIPSKRRSLDKPLSSSNLTKPNHPSSKQRNAIVTPSPRERTTPLRSSSTQVKSTKLSKPISDGSSKTLRDGKTKPLVTKKVANGKASANSRNNAKSTAENAEGSNVETEEVKEVTKQEVEVIIKVENEEHKVEHEHDISHVVESLHDHGLEEFGHESHNEAYEEKVISTVSEEAPKKEPQEKKTEDEHEEKDSTNKDENKINESHPEDHSLAEGEVEVNEKEDKDRVIIEDTKSEKNNEEEAVKAKEASEKVEEVKAEPISESKQQVAAGGNGKKESQISNGVIEETASKLLEERKNKVRALAGAFQTVIDYQAPTK